MARYYVEMTYAITYKIEVEANDGGSAIETATHKFAGDIAEARGAGCLLSDVSAKRIR